MENNEYQKSKVNEYEKIELKMLKNSNPLAYNLKMCQIIKKNTTQIELPRLTNTEMTQLKENITEYKKINKDTLEYNFLNLYNIFRLIQKFEENPDLQKKIRTILRYLEEYKYIFDLIIESQGKEKNIKLEKAMTILTLEINMFCMQYAHLLTDTDPSMNTFKTPLTPNDEDEDTYDPQKLDTYIDNHEQDL